MYIGIKLAAEAIQLVFDVRIFEQRSTWAVC